MMADINQLDKQEQRKSMNRSAVKLDLRASQELNREAVKRDLRSAGAASGTALAPTYEKSEDGSSNQGDKDDPFASTDPFASILSTSKVDTNNAQEETKSAPKHSANKNGDTESDEGDDEAGANLMHRGMVAI